MYLCGKGICFHLPVEASKFCLKGAQCSQLTAEDFRIDYSENALLTVAAADLTSLHENLGLWYPRATMP
ncbi:hypothetical protein T265_08947 [Opisthorchis viverrini]|uniref:Uncharacterized protein n=1 Tax=Opisthorchis viverrini TaxID=6198 RepID=A0A074ZBW5_OPIVI|nr:hypothetical protein T265_08947 [Opisthorchis viverrini]KER23092.1 hypothetical protein T265_08947 [Opisthorchis viverrini]